VAITWVTFSFLQGNKVTVRTVALLNFAALVLSSLCAGALATTSCLANVAGQCILESSSPACLGACAAMAGVTCGESLELCVMTGMMRNTTRALHSVRPPGDLLTYRPVPGPSVLAMVVHSVRSLRILFPKARGPESPT
jgi:hypothetical protein